MKYYRNLLICLLVIVTVFLRFVVLDMVPPHLSNDEISIAYDAYSILHTGRDEHNKFMPISFQSHSTYKAPLYIYIASVSNYFFGNSDFSVRFPSAVFGSLTVFLIGFLMYLFTLNFNLAILTSFVLSTTPWHIYTSRMALESNIALFFLLLGVTLIIKSKLLKNNVYFVFSMISFALSIWGYHTQWLLTPLIMIVLSIIYRKHIIFNYLFFVGIFIFFVLVFPIYFDAYVNKSTNARANTEIITKDVGISEVLNNKDVNILYKSRMVLKSFFVNYSNYTKPSNLFFDGLSLLPKEDPYTVGLFLFPLLPIFYWGLLKIKFYLPNDYIFIYLWILISPVVASMTIGGTNLVRNLPSVLPYVMAITIGIYDICIFAKKYIAVFGLLILFAFVYFMVLYFYHFPFQSGENFQYGYKQAAHFISQNYYKYDQIVVDPRFGNVNIYVGVPHLYLSYFTQMDPNKMLARQDTDKGLFFDKYQIRSVNWNQEIIVPKTLYLVPFDNFPINIKNDLNTALEIKLPNYKVEFGLFENK